MLTKETEGGGCSQDEGSAGFVYSGGSLFFGFLYKTAFLTALLSILSWLFLSQHLFGEYSDAPFFYLGIILVVISGIVLFATFPIGMICFPCWKMAIRALLAAGIGEKTSIVMVSIPTTLVGIHLLFSIIGILFFDESVNTLLVVGKLELIAMLVGFFVAPLTAWKSY